MRHRLGSIGALALALAVAGYACGSSNGAHTGSSATTQGAGSGGNTTTSSSSSGAGASGAGGGDGGLVVDHGAVTSLAVTPKAATIDVMNGAPASATFVATATFADKTTQVVTPAWTFDRLDIALVDGTGKLTANGMLGGHGTVTASFGGQMGTAGADVKLHVVQNPANLPAGSMGAFGSPDGNPSGTLLYPYDQTVFARGILAPELQWSGGNAGDAYLVHLSETYFDAQIYVNADPPSRFLLPADVWTQLTQSNAGESVALDVQRLSASTAHQAMHETWTIAQGSLRGSIYYWAVNTGQLMKVAPGASSPVVIFDSGPADQLGTPAPASYNGTVPPWESGGNNKRCVACHTVSKDGSTIAAVFEKKGSTASPWGTIDLTQATPSVVQITPYTSTTIYLGLTPDGAYAAQNDLAMTMSLVNAKTGAAVASALDGFTDKTCDPSFSPDGKHLAFAGNVTGFYPVEYTIGDLDVMDFDEPTTTLTNRRTIVPAGGQAVAFPSFSPDSAWLLFQKGDYSRAKYGTTSIGHDDLYMVDLAMQTGVLSLANASGASLSAQNQHISYQPTVNPIAVGGYIWVVFVSPRDYGNRMLSTTNPTYENRKQLWVAAVDVSPQAGKDPSHPAFWLPGQDLTTINMSGYWALEACHQNGTSCDQGFECCSGFCQPDGTGKYSCVPPPSGCSQIGNKCTTSADCCNAGTVSCIGGFCSLAQPH